MDDNKPEIEKNWYVIRVTYNREMKVKAELDSLGVENFVPMAYRVVMRGDRRVRVLQPAVHNLIFIRMTREEMKNYKMTTRLPIRYMMNAEKNVPLVVPEWQMRNFIAVSGTNDEQLVYLDPQEIGLHKGDRVRVTGGIFCGLEGTFMRVRGDRRIVVSIPGIIAVATAFIHPSLIEKLPNVN